MEKKWFRAKTYGYGWIPSAWQGWFCLFTYLLLVILSVISNTVYFHQVNTAVLAEVAFYTLILLLICYYTGEKPHWQWGKKKS